MRSFASACCCNKATASRWLPARAASTRGPALQQAPYRSSGAAKMAGQRAISDLRELAGAVTDGGGGNSRLVEQRHVQVGNGRVIRTAHVLIALELATGT